VGVLCKQGVTGSIPVTSTIFGCFPVPFLSCSFPSWALSTPVSKPGFPSHDEIIKKFSVSDINRSARRECLCMVWAFSFLLTPLQ